MKNLAAEIPKRAFINAQIIQQALESEAFQTTVVEVVGGMELEITNL